MAQMSDLHIEDFCKDTAKILVILYQSFPQSMTLYVEDICGPDTPDEFGLHSPRFVASFNTLLWLAKADYIHYSDTVKQEALEGVTLTHKLFTFLCDLHNPLSLEETTNDKPCESRAATLRDSIKYKTSTQLKTLVLEYMKASRPYL